MMHELTEQERQFIAQALQMVQINGTYKEVMIITKQIAVILDKLKPTEKLDEN